MLIVLFILLQLATAVALLDFHKIFHEEGCHGIAVLLSNLIDTAKVFPNFLTVFDVRAQH